MEVIIENVRCFHGRNTIPVTPVTLLVGENSTGKSTFLAVLAAMAKSSDFPFPSAFNAPPYDLGNYADVATRKSTNGRPAASFKTGFHTTKKEKGGERTVIATWEGHLGQVVLSEFTVKTPNSDITAEIRRKETLVRIGYLSDTVRKESAFTLKPPTEGGGFISTLVREILKRDSKEARELVTSGVLLLMGNAFPSTNVLSIAPIRTKPRRTYDQFNEEFKPEGDHVPLKLARLLESEETDGHAYRDAVMEAMKKFGQESGLFEGVEIERHGNASSPFRVAVHVGGLILNLIDVGYGVSQSLPIVVQSLTSKKGAVLLMQQPEVHLHPKAQAALGTFFATLAKTEKLRFVIETHSDYLLDRVRQEVAKGTVRPEDVTILFFDKKNGHSKIHVVSVDKEGNVMNAPEGYRSFFLQEEMNLLTRGPS